MSLVILLEAMRHIMIMLIFASGLIITSCTKTRSNEKKTLDFGQFTIEVPSTWSKVKLRGTDSYVGRIAIDETDTLSFDLGWYSNNLVEEPPFTFRITEKGNEVHLLNEEKSTSDSLVYDFVGMTTEVNLSALMRDTALYTVIDNRKAMIVKPKKAGKGKTGVYFDSVWVAGSDIDRFQINGQNLKPDNEQLVLEAIKTLRFKK
jgi:hypothetical protein